jgi:hypothetical protein
MEGAPQGRSLGVIAAALMGIFAVGWTMEHSERFSGASDTLQEQTVPSYLLRYGATGEILRSEGFVEPEWNDGRYSRTKGAGALETASVFTKKRQVGETLLRARKPGPAIASIEIDPSDVIPSWPTLAIRVDPKGLYDDEVGIIPNWDEKWEKPAACAFFVDGEKVFEADCGIRLHGNTTRDGNIMRDRGLTWRSYRLYFRSDYGPEQMPAGLVLDPSAGPLRSLVVRGNSFLCSTIAYSIAHKLGTAAPSVRLVNLVLNGERVKEYVATEHISKRQTAARLGHKNFLFYKLRSPGNDKKDKAGFAELRNWVRNRDASSTARQINRYIDLKDYMRHMFVVLHAGASDWGEGAVIRDLGEDAPRWRWTHWDMDNAYRDPHGDLLMGLSTEGWAERFLDHALVPPHKADLYPRAELFQVLMKTKWFPMQFAKLAQDILNHEIPPEYLASLQDHFAQMREINGVNDGPARFVRQRLDRRPAIIRADLREQVGLGEPRTLSVTAPAGARLRVDGYAYAASYSGWHFPDWPVTVEIPAKDVSPFSHWLVDGQRREGRQLELHLEQATEVEAVFGD